MENIVEGIHGETGETGEEQVLTVLIETLVMVSAGKLGEKRISMRYSIGTDLVLRDCAAHTR